MTELTPELLRERLDRFWGPASDHVDPSQLVRLICSCGKRFPTASSWGSHRAGTRRSPQHRLVGYEVR